MANLTAKFTMKTDATVTVSVLTLATLGEITQLGWVLFVLQNSRHPRLLQITATVAVAGSFMENFAVRFANLKNTGAYFFTLYISSLSV